MDMVSLTVQDPVQAETLLSTPYLESFGDVSPDGGWLAYQSDASGQYEVYVAPFPDVERGRQKISIDGVLHPVWSPTSDELFYLALTGDIMAAAFELTPSFEPGRAEPRTTPTTDRSPSSSRRYISGSSA